MEKYRFQIEPLSAPDGLIVENGRLVGLRFRRTKMENGKLVSTDETFERRGAVVISSIGSIPEPIPGIDMKGELFAFSDWDLGRLDALPERVLGGQRRHRQGQHRGLAQARGPRRGRGDRGVPRRRRARPRGRRGRPRRAPAPQTRAKAEAIAKLVADKPPHDAATMTQLEAKVRALQERVGHTGDYAAWIERVTPAELE